MNCARLTVGAGGHVAGDIKANEVVVRGKVKGIIRAARIMLLDSADVAGDVFFDKMSMEEGAQFVGASNAEPQSAVLRIQILAELSPGGRGATSLTSH